MGGGQLQHRNAWSSELLLSEAFNDSDLAGDSTV